MNLRKEIRALLETVDHEHFSIEDVRTHKKCTLDDPWFGYIDIEAVIPSGDVKFTIYYDEGTHPEGLELIKVNDHVKWPSNIQREITTVIEKNMKEIEEQVSYHIEDASH